MHLTFPKNLIGQVALVTRPSLTINGGFSA
jgi:hypothetical protein